MEINFNTAQERYDEIKSYLDLTESKIVKDYINECLQNTIFATKVYNLFSEELVSIFIEMCEVEKTNFISFKTNLENSYNDVFIDKNEIVDKIINETGSLSYISMMLISKIVSESIDSNGDLLFNKLFKIDISKLEKINVEKISRLINEKFIENLISNLLTGFGLTINVPIPTDLYSSGKFAYDIYKASILEENLKEGFNTTDKFMLYLEDYNNKIISWINHTVFLVNNFREIQKGFSEKFSKISFDNNMN